MDGSRTDRGRLASTKMIFEAFCPTSCGFITVDRRRVQGRPVWRVGSVHVEEEFRRRGVATKLYEAAARAACQRAEPLASLAMNREPTALSNEFWRKQQRKGRVDVVAGRDGPTYIVRCPVTSLAGPRRGT